MNVPQKCTIGVRWLVTAHTYPSLLIYLTILSVQMFWSSIPSFILALVALQENQGK